MSMSGVSCWQGHLFIALEVLAGKEWRGSLDFVQAKGDSVTPRWVLISATEALLVLNKDAALTAHRLWKMETLRWCFRGNHEAGAWRKMETCPYLHFAHKSYMWGFLYILSLGEQGRGGSQELLPALITQSTVYYSQNFLMRQPEPK